MNLLQHHIDTIPAGRGRKNRDTPCIWEHGVPPVLPSACQQKGSAPDLQLASHQGKTKSVLCTITLPAATGPLGKQKI